MMMDNAATPKKYIRTFAGDIEAVKKGVVPNLSPLKKAEAEPKPEPRPSPLQTYAGDFSDRMKETKASTATVLAAEQDAAKGAPQKTPEKHSGGNVLYFTAGAVLLILGIAGSYIAYTRYLSKSEPIILAPTVTAPIFVDDKEKISGTSPNEVLQAIEQSVVRPLAPNTVRFLYTDFATTTDNSIFSLLQLPAPGSLLRNVNASRSMAGIINTGESQSPFFILSVASYGDTFAGMLQWEPTMSRDLNALFSEHPQIQISTTTAATSTPVHIPSFRDEVASNHDVRIYRDAEGRGVLLYGYWNQSTLVVARDQSAFMEIIERLAATRTQP